MSALGLMVEMLVVDSLDASGETVNETGRYKSQRFCEFSNGIQQSDYRIFSVFFFFFVKDHHFERERVHCPLTDAFVPTSRYIQTLQSTAQYLFKNNNWTQLATVSWGTATLQFFHERGHDSTTVSRGTMVRRCLECETPAKRNEKRNIIEERFHFSAGRDELMKFARFHCMYISKRECCRCNNREHRRNCTRRLS